MRLVLLFAQVVERQHGQRVLLRDLCGWLFAPWAVDNQPSRKRDGDRAEQRDEMPLSAPRRSPRWRFGGRRLSSDGRHLGVQSVAALGHGLEHGLVPLVAAREAELPAQLVDAA